MKGLSSYRGTQAETWAIGSDKVELRNVNDELYMRLPSGAYSKVTSEAQLNSLSRALRQWQPGVLFLQNEPVLYNGILYVCNNDHTSSATFELDAANFTFISVFDGFTYISPTPLGQTVLDKTSGTLVYVDSAAGSGVYKLFLPNAVTLAFGHRFKIINASSTYVVEVYYNDQSTLFTSIEPGTSKEMFYVEANLTNGIFATTDTPPSGTLVVNQVAHGFAFGDLVYIEDTTGVWYKAIADDVEKTADGIVSVVYGADAFQVTTSGYVNGVFPSPVIAGKQYFLSAAVAGAYTDTEPLYISQPVFKAISATQILVRNDRPSENLVNGVEFEILVGASISLGPDSAQYLIYLRSDPRICGDVRYRSGFAPEIGVIGVKPIANTDTPATLSIFDSGGQLFVKNNLAATEKILVFKNYVAP